MDAWLEGAWGRVNMGQGDGAANGATESDLSGTGLANGIGVADLGGGFGYRTAGGALSGVTVGGSINQQDFESRYDRLLYVTPNFGGLRASELARAATQTSRSLFGTAPTLAAWRTGCRAAGRTGASVPAAPDETSAARFPSARPGASPAHSFNRRAPGLSPAACVTRPSLLQSASSASAASRGTTRLATISPRSARSHDVRIGYCSARSAGSSSPRRTRCMNSIAPGSPKTLRSPHRPRVGS